jgi:hypothetical protein
MNASERPLIEPRLAQTSPSGIEVPVRVGPESAESVSIT